MNTPCKTLSCLLLLFSAMTLNQSCSNAQNKLQMDNEHPYTNHLINESSPYLLQHAHNPVDWFPWSEEALDKAKKESKLIIVSIGYAACHWCHVMEHESFEDTTVAKVMNDNFISIKVDREERPDIDQIYMNACQIITGQGGWPLNTVALPDGRPIFAGTYFPKDQWIKVLNQVLNYYRDNPEKAREYAQQVTDGIISSELISVKAEEKKFTEQDLATVYNNFENAVDFSKGGRKGSPKFPMPVNYQFLLNYYHLSNNDKALEAVTVTLDNMANGGIYDHVGGGFARYSTDAHWHVPHFEKMLYDNGQLVSLYSSAYQLTKNPLYKKMVYETIEWVEREMTTKEGGFYSSLDADSEGEEGKFYVWTAQEINSLLGNDAELFMEYYDINEKGNWEHGNNILRREKSAEEIAKKFNLSIEKLESAIKVLKSTVLKEREKRIRPGLDDKILTSWNALMLKGYADAYRVFGEKRFLKAAEKNADFILTKASDGDKLNRNYKNGKSTISGFLDDYSLTIEAFIALYQATFDEKWIKQALAWTEYTLVHFHDKQGGMFYYTSNEQEGLIARKMEISDNVIRASNSSMAKKLFMLGHYFYKEDYITMAEQMLSNVNENVKSHSTFYANWALLQTWIVSEPYEIAIVGKDHEKIRKQLDRQFLPNVFFLGGNDEGTLPLLKHKLVEGQTTIYVCRYKTCKLPVTTAEDALKQMD